MKPELTLTEDEISITFFDCVIKINIKEDKLYSTRYGKTKRILTTNTIKDYDLDSKRTENNEREHRRFFQHCKNNYLLLGNVGHDGRVFFLVFTKRNYNLFRGKPFWVVSYFHNRKLKLKDFFVTDMRKPVKTWKYGEDKHDIEDIKRHTR